MKAFEERECSKVFVLQQIECVSTSYILKQCHLHSVLVPLYVEPGEDFKVVFFKSLLALFV